MGLDHGTLNVPLAKRGNIDAQIDKWKREQAAEKKAARREAEAKRKALKPVALAMVDAIPAERMKEHALAANMTVGALVRRLRSDCHWRPAFVIDLINKATGERVS